jgi:hypothetical protein
VELAQLVEQAVGAPLRRGQIRLQDLEDDTILIISFHKFCVFNLFIILNSVLQKASTRANPHYLDV